jgi:hypothetical protein
VTGQGLQPRLRRRSPVSVGTGPTPLTEQHELFGCGIAVGAAPV